ncbi:MAG: 2-oxoglutarate and iron-dependent oxygenase domain-containing protein [Ilumatobacteraceae bacterium]
MRSSAHLPGNLPIIDIGPLLDPSASAPDVADIALEIDHACREIGFFGIVGHGVAPGLQADLERAAHEFFALPEEDKATIAMVHAGRAWRGWFPVGGELTSGRPDRKEGIYFGAEHPADHPRVVAGEALHGANLAPTRPAELGPLVDAWLVEMHGVASTVIGGIALALGLPRHWFADHLTYDATELFRIFHYPPSHKAAPTHDDDWGVAEHTDYGLLTVLAQDELGGLEVARRDGGWTIVEPVAGMFVCNLGDMLERLTNGRYRSTPHRVRNTSTRGRLSFPYFFDPSWDATVPVLPIGGAPDPAADDGRARWDGADVTAWDGRYGDYLTAKVAKVFPELFAAT